MKHFESIERSANPVYWRTKSGKELGFQCEFDREKGLMILSDGIAGGKRYTAKKGVLKDGKFHACCDGKVPLDHAEVQYYVELEDDAS